MRKRACAALCLGVLAGCLEYGPHVLPRDASERDLNRKAIERLVADPPSGPLVIAVLGDTQESFDESEDAVASVNARDDVQLVVQVGDFTHVGTLLEYQLMNEIFARLRVPYLVVAGYHDLLGNGARIYAEMFGPTNFAFDLGRVRLVFFDSNSEAYGHDGSVPDLAWLAAALGAAPEPEHALAFAHVAPDGDSFLDGRLAAPLLALFADAGVDVSFHGHAHRADAFELGGVRIVLADSLDHRTWVLVRQREDGGFDVERIPF